MTPESIIILAIVIAAIVIAAAVAVAIWKLRKKKDDPAPQSAQATPPSAANMGLLAQAMIDAPRSLGQRTPGAGQGDFGGGS